MVMHARALDADLGRKVAKARLMREWQGRTYEVVVLDDGFSWLGTRCNSLSAIARKITGTAWSGPLFFGLKQARSAGRPSSHAPLPGCGTIHLDRSYCIAGSTSLIIGLFGALCLFAGSLAPSHPRRDEPPI
jgi:hypothetical protein